MRIELIHPRELGEAEAALWRGWQAAEGLGSPYLSPDWAKLVGTARADARVVVFIENGSPVGFFGAQRPSRFAAMGLGAPISDYQAFIAAPGVAVNANTLCGALQVGRIDLTHVPPGQDFFAPHARGEAGSWTIDTSVGLAGYRAALKERRAEFVRQTDKKWRKFEREQGPLRVTALSRHRADFCQMLGWKRMQLLRTGQPAIWDAPWVSRVLDATFDNPEGDCQGAFFTLHAGDRLVAANYFLRSPRVLHDWIMAHNPAFEPYSPGVLLARAAIEWAAENGVPEFDFGPGQYQYKRQLSTGQRMLSWGSAAPNVSASGLVRTAAYTARAQLERLEKHPQIASLPGKAMRRVDLMRGLAGPR